MRYICRYGILPSHCINILTVNLLANQIRHPKISDLPPIEEWHPPELDQSPIYTQPPTTTQQPIILTRKPFREIWKPIRKPDTKRKPIKIDDTNEVLRDQSVAPFMGAMEESDSSWKTAYIAGSIFVGTGVVIVIIAIIGYFRRKSRAEPCTRDEQTSQDGSHPIAGDWYINVVS